MASSAAGLKEWTGHTRSIIDHQEDQSKRRPHRKDSGGNSAGLLLHWEESSFEMEIQTLGPLVRI
jgi:hypothetical protein